MFDIKTLRECEAEEFDKLQEAWSPAARAASAAARSGRGAAKSRSTHGAAGRAGINSSMIQVFAKFRKRLAAKIKSGRSAARTGGTGARSGKSSGISSQLTRTHQASKLKAKKFGSRLSGSKYRLANPYRS